MFIVAATHSLASSIFLPLFWRSTVTLKVMTSVLNLKLQLIKGTVWHFGKYLITFLVFPAPLKLNTWHFISCSFNLYKNKSIKMTTCRFYTLVWILDLCQSWKTPKRYSTVDTVLTPNSPKKFIFITLVKTRNFIYKRQYETITEWVKCELQQQTIRKTKAHWLTHDVSLV